MTHRVLSIFIDESGDFGKLQNYDDRYIVGLVFHDQSDDISSNIHNFEKHLEIAGFSRHAVHTGPLIRREEYYQNDLMERRVQLFNSIFNCARKMPINYSHILVHKREWNDSMKLNSRISKELGDLISSKSDYFCQFDSIIIYYDNGQTELTRIINSVFSSHFSNVDIRKVQPVNYLLFQIADLICTMELLADKLETKSFSKSELDFFKTHRDFKKNYLKWIQKKQL